MRYNSPTTQLAILTAVLMLTTVINRLLNVYLLQSSPTDLNLMYDSYWPTSLVACLSGFIGIFLVNLIGARVILLFYCITSILFFGSIVSTYTIKTKALYSVMKIIDAAGYDFGRVATLVLVLAYPSERWKARSLALFLFIENFSLTLGDILVLRNPGDETSRLRVAIAGLCLTCLAPVFALAIAPANRIVRSNGVYLVARETSLSEELCGTRAIFKNKYMLLLLPYMFSYPFLFGAANVPFPTILAIILYDIGRIFIVLMSLMLDMPWASRRFRSLISLGMLVVVCIVSIAITIATRASKTDKSAIDPTWSEMQISDYIFDQSIRDHGDLLYSCYFFAGVASGFVELFGYWVIGTLTNDIKTSARFVGTYQSTLSIGGMVGVQMVQNIPHQFTTSNIPTYISTGFTLVSFVFMFFVVRRITETNDWTLGSISDHESPSNEHSSESITIIADVKYQHTND